MAGNARFHNKLHRRNHHSNPSPGYPDSGTDPIASADEPFIGDFFLGGSLSASNDATVDGNLLVYGNLSALGEYSIFETIVSTTSALSVVNSGTGPALTVIQKGLQPVARFFDDSHVTLTIDDNFKTSFYNSAATGPYSIAMGVSSRATAPISFASGTATVAQGIASHTEGAATTAWGPGAHAEGYNTYAFGQFSHAEGDHTYISGDYAHVEGLSSVAVGDGSHAEGQATMALGDHSHAEGEFTTASGPGSHAEGLYTSAFGVAAHAEGNSTYAADYYSHAEGNLTLASGFNSHAEGDSSVASGDTSHAEGSSTRAIGTNSHAEGYQTVASGNYTHAEGYATSASGSYGHAEGKQTLASGPHSHAEGGGTTASGLYSHAEGNQTLASGSRSHAEGYQTLALGNASHAEGLYTSAKGSTSHAAGSYAIAAHDRTWIWQGSTATYVISTTRTDQFMVSAAGGVYIPGNVGIGTDDNTNALSLKGTISAFGDHTFRALATDGSGVTIAGSNTSNEPQLQISRLDTDKFNFRVRGTTGQAYLNIYDQTNSSVGEGIILQGNNVGIGTNAPEQKLHVLKASAGTVTADTNSIAVFEGGGNAHISILTPDAQTGGVVFGSPTDNFGSYLSWNYSNKALKLATASNNGFIQLLTNNEAEAVRITSSGNVGIGTTVPAEKLTVNGNISSNGTVFTTSLTSSGLTVNGNISSNGTVFTTSLTSGDINLIHAPTADGVNPILRIGECTPWSTTLSGFSGFQIEYNETTNELNLSALGFNTAKQAMKVTAEGNTGINLLSAISPNYNNLTVATRGISGAAIDDLAHLIQGRTGINTYPVTGYALHVKGGNIRIDGVDYSATPGFDGTVYDTDGQSLFDLRSAHPDANYSLSISQSGLGNFMKFFGGRRNDDKPFINVKENTPMRFGTFDTFYGTNYKEHMRIGRNGNVGIHTNHPWIDGQYDNAVAEALTVNGNISASGALSAANPVVASYFAGSACIGTNLPSARFHNVGTTFAGIPAQTGPLGTLAYEQVFGLSTGSRRFLICKSNKDLTQVTQGNNNLMEVVYTDFGDAEFRVYDNANSINHTLCGRGNSFLAFNTSDRVGVGTKTPNEKLTVQGNISAFGDLMGYGISARNIDLIHTPANDGRNPVIRIGESDTGTGNSGFSGIYASYNENTNVFGISSVFTDSPRTTAFEAVAIDRNGNIGLGTTPLASTKLTVVGNISASGSIIGSNFGGATPYTLTFTPYVTALSGFKSSLASGVTGTGGSLNVYPAALSGVMPSDVLTQRFQSGTGTIEGNFFFDKSDNGSNVQYLIEIAKDQAFTNNLVGLYVRSTGETNRVLIRPIVGIYYGSLGRIVFPPANSTTPFGSTGSSSAATISYPYVPGDALYWRIGFLNAGELTTSSGVISALQMALSAGYMRVVPSLSA